MIGNFDNDVMSSMILFVDNVVCNVGQGYTNYSGNFYNTNDLFNNTYTYSLPFKQIIADSSVSGANVLSGIYLSGSFITGNQNGLIGINHQNGQVFFSNNVTANQLSGNYAVKDFNIYLTNKPEQELLFETKYSIKPKTSQNLDGLAPNAQTIPAIFIKSNNSINDPFALGGTVDSKIDIRLIVLADSLFNLDAVCGVLRDTAYQRMPLIKNTDLNLNYLNCLNSGFYNYNSLKSSKFSQNELFYIEEVSISKNFAFMDKINPGIFPAFVDFTLSKIRTP
jgi:hypothetical protein